MKGARNWYIWMYVLFYQICFLVVIWLWYFNIFRYLMSFNFCLPFIPVLYGYISISQGWRLTYLSMRMRKYFLVTRWFVLPNASNWLWKFKISLERRRRRQRYLESKHHKECGGERKSLHREDDFPFNPSQYWMCVARNWKKSPKMVCWPVSLALETKMVALKCHKAYKWHLFFLFYSILFSREKIRISRSASCWFEDCQ